MKLTLTNALIVIAVALAVLATGTVLFGGQRTVQGAAFQATNITAATTTNAFSFTTSTRVLATSTKDTYGNITGYTRVYATICTRSATPIALAFANDANVSSTNSVAFIAAAAGYNNCYEITDKNAYQGSVTASSTIGAVVVNAADFYAQ